jgi:SprB-like repeat protein
VRQVPCGSSQHYDFFGLVGCGVIQDVKVDGISQGPLSSYTFTNVRSDHTLEATFSPVGTAMYTIAASAGAGGRISPSGTSNVTCGETRTYTITPNPCFRISNVVVDGVSQGQIPSYTFNQVISNHGIAALFTPTSGPYAITASAGPGGTISPIGVTSVACGASQTYLITPNACARIDDVIVDGVSQGPIGSYTFTSVGAAHGISATFSPAETFTITASAGAGATISPSGATTVACGGSQSYTIAPSGDCGAYDVSVDGASKGRITAYTFTNVQANHSITVTINPGPFTIAASASGGGTITPSGVTSVACGGSQSYTITSPGGCPMFGVMVDGVSRGAITSYTFDNVTTNHTISATFTPGPFTITASAGASGTITPVGVTSVACGGSQSYAMTPSGACAILDVRVDGVSQGPITSYTFNNVVANHTISVTFSTGPFTITASANAGGTISPSGVTSVACGGSQSYTIARAGSCGGYDVKVDGISQGSITSYTFTNVTVNHTISVTFSGGPFTINATAGVGGSISPAGTSIVACGTGWSCQIVHADCYKVRDVVVDGLHQGPITSYSFPVVSSNHTVLALFSSNSAFTISANAGPGGTISPSGASSVTCKSNKSFTIAASDNCHVIQDVKVDGQSRGPINYHLFSNIQEDHTIEATFRALGPFTIVASAGAGGAIIPSGAISVECGAGQSYSFVPDECHRVENVKVNGQSRGSLTGYTLAGVTGNQTIEVVFAELGPFAIDAAAGPGGTISPKGGSSAACGSSVDYTIAPSDACHAIQDVKVDGVSQGPIASYTFAGVTGAHAIEAAFSTLGPYTITANPGAGSTIEPPGSASVACGGGLSYTIAPELCQAIRDVQVDGVSVGAVDRYAFADVRGNHTITASAGPGMTLSETHAGASWSSDGAIDVTVAGGAPPYSYAWSNGASSEHLGGLAGGPYTVRVMDSQGCTEDLTVTITSDVPTSVALGKPTPNPSAGPVRLRYALPATTAVRVSVLDLQGREVAVLADGTRPAGWGWATWDGATRDGRAPGGVYFIRLKAGGRQIVQRFALIR